MASWLSFSESISQAAWQRGYNVQVWIYAVSVRKEIKDSELRKVLLISRCRSGSTKTCPRWYLLIQIASKSYTHLKIANYLIPVMLTIPIRKQLLSNSCALMFFFLPPTSSMPDIWVRKLSSSILSQTQVLKLMLDCPMHLQVILGYKPGYQRSNFYYHSCQMSRKSISKLLKHHLSSM